MSVKELLEEHLELLDRIDLEIIDLEVKANALNLTEREESKLHCLYWLKSFTKTNRDLKPYIEEGTKEFKVALTAKGFDDENGYAYTGYTLRLNIDFTILGDVRLEALLGESNDVS